MTTANDNNTVINKYDNNDADNKGFFINTIVDVSFLSFHEDMI